jgi:hypothetical protein
MRLKNLFIGLSLLTILVGVVVVPVSAKKVVPKESFALLQGGAYYVEDGNPSVEGVVLVDFKIADSQKPPRFRWRLDIYNDRSIDLIILLDKKSPSSITFGPSGQVELGDLDGDGDLDAIVYPDLSACIIEGKFILRNTASSEGDQLVDGRLLIGDGFPAADTDSDFFYLWLDLSTPGDGTWSDSFFSIIDNGDLGFNIVDNDDPGIILSEVTQNFHESEEGNVPTEEFDKTIFGDIKVILAS